MSIPKWYPLLIPREDARYSLYSSEIISPNNLIVCKKDNQGFHKYALFDDFIAFHKYWSQLPNHEKTFFEVIRNTSQKVYFDIDLTTEEMSHEKALEKLKKTIILLRKFLLGITKANFCIQVYSSHSETKISYHIVIDGIYVANAKQNSLFFKNFTEEISVKYSVLFDPKVYKSLQQFRMLYSQKPGTNRVKKPEQNLFINNKGQDLPLWCNFIRNAKQMSLFLLKSSLITEVSNCEFICFPEPINYKNYLSVEDGYLDIDEKHIDQALELYREHSKSIPFKVFDIHADGNLHTIVTLKRLGSSYCPLCERNHENENPYLLFWGREINVCIDCRRTQDGQKLFLGVLNPDKSLSSSSNIENIPVIPTEQKTISLFEIKTENLKPQTPSSFRRKKR